MKTKSNQRRRVGKGKKHEGIQIEKKLEKEYMKKKIKIKRKKKYVKEVIKT